MPHGRFQQIRPLAVFRTDMISWRSPYFFCLADPYPHNAYRDAPSLAVEKIIPFFVVGETIFKAKASVFLWSEQENLTAAMSFFWGG